MGEAFRSRTGGGGVQPELNCILDSAERPLVQFGRLSKL
jgi:hypothetical protein